MTDTEMYDLLCAKAQNIKMHMQPEDVAEIAKRFNELIKKQDATSVVRYVGADCYCPVCNNEIEAYLGRINYCDYCGQKLNWEMEEV